LRERYGRAPFGAVLVVDPYLGSAGGISPELHAFRARYPYAALLAAFWQRQGETRDVLRMIAEGVSDFLFLDEENTEAAIRRRLEPLRSRPIRALLPEGIADSLSGTGQGLLNKAVETVAAGGTVADFAAALALSPRNLNRRTHAARLPPPKELLRWIRVLLAAALLEDEAHTIHDVSVACGYADDRGLQRLIHGLLETTPSALQGRGATDRARDAFRARLASPARLRSIHREYAP
jgi:AraC-like DNA-binding protein